MSDVDGAALGAGTEGRQWVETGLAVAAQPQRYETTEREQRIPMRDGISLAATIIEPVLPDGPPPQPCIVVTNGYSGLDVWLYPNLRRLAGHGYPVVLARLRGVPPSEGKGGLYEHYGPDGYDVTGGRGAQPFCDGRVGMAGGSLLGISQWLAAREQPPHLVVVAPDDSPNDTYSYLWYVGGMEPGPGRKGRAEGPGVESEYGQAAAHPWFDDFWGQRAARREDIQDLARHGLPALTSTGWGSYMVDAGGPPRPPRHRPVAARRHVPRRRHARGGRPRRADPPVYRLRDPAPVVRPVAARRARRPRHRAPGADLRAGTRPVAVRAGLAAARRAPDPAVPGRRAERDS